MHPPDPYDASELECPDCGARELVAEGILGLRCAVCGSRFDSSYFEED